MNSSLTPKSRRGLWLSLTTLGLMGALIAVPLQSAKQAVVTNDDLAQATSSFRPGFEDYDIRLDDKSKDKLESFRSALGKSSLTVESDLKKTINGGDALRQRIPTLKVELNQELQNAGLITPDILRGFDTLTAAGSGKNSETLRTFIRSNNDLFGINDEQAGQLKVTADYTNPDGNLAYATLEQFINGVPVYRGEVRASFTRRGEMFRVINNLAPNLEYSGLSANFGEPVDAVRAAFSHVTREITSADLQSNAAKSGDLKATFGDGQYPTTAEKMYFPTESGVARAAWRVLIWEDVAAFYVIIDAETGTMLSRENIVRDQSQNATYNVWANTNSMVKSLDSPAPLTPGPVSPVLGTQGTAQSRTSVTLVGNEAPYTFNNNGWITDGGNATEGNNTIAGLDRYTPNGVDAPITGSTNRVFNYATNPPPGNPTPGEEPIPTGQTISPCSATAPTVNDSQKAAAVQMFYVTNRYHDEMYRLGFVEQAKNFQNDNFGRGGTGNDRVSAEGQDCSGTNNANFATPADGTSGRMQMYVFTNPTPDRDGTIDAEIIIHELTHGLFGRLNPGAISNTQAGQMNEGNSDFYAHAMLAEPSDPINSIYAVGGYATLNWRAAAPFNNTGNYYYGIRRFPRAVLAFTGGDLNRPHNPLTFADIDPAQMSLTDGAFAPAFVGSATAVHDGGEVWSSTLWEFRARLMQRLGNDAGNRKTLQIVTDGLKNNPPSPTMLGARDAIIQAAAASSLSPNASADVADAWAGFASRGMGFGATNTTGNTVTQSFALPNAVVAPTGFAVADPAPGGDGDGYPEPTETVVLTVPVINNTGNTVNNVTAAVTGGGTANYGNIADGQTVTRQIAYTIPASAPCGSLHEVSIVVTTALGTQGAVTRSFRLGAPVGGAPASFENTAAITVTDNSPATPYPSNITVSGLTGNKVIKVQLTGLTHSWPDDVDVLLEGPNGQSLIIMADVGGGDDVSGINVTLTDAATAGVPDGGPLAAGEFKPTNVDTTTDVFPAPAPTTGVNNPAPAGSATFASVFGTSGANLNGTWKLYIRDDVGQDAGTISGGWKITFEANDYNCQVGTSTAPTNSRADFDGDGKTDVSVFRGGTWYAQQSTAGFVGVQWGAASDQIVPGDYDGDNKTDFAVYRAGATSGAASFYVLNSATSTVSGVLWGVAGDIAKVGDFDGNNRDDFAVYRPSANAWYVTTNPSGTFVQYTLAGTTGSGSTPITLDYDGDGKTDPAQWNTSTGAWAIRTSGSGATVNVQWGAAGDIPVPADYLGNDNRDELVVYRAGNWLVRLDNGTLVSIAWGAATDVPVPGDYDGDGVDDQAVYRGGTWFVRGSTSNLTTTFGVASDTPIPRAFTGN